MTVYHNKKSKVEPYTRLEKRMTRAPLITELSPTAHKIFMFFVEDFFAANRLSTVDPKRIDSWLPIQFGPANVSGPPRDSKTFYRHRDALVQKKILTCVKYGGPGISSTFTLGSAIVKLFRTREKGGIEQGILEPSNTGKMEVQTGDFPQTPITSTKTTTTTGEKTGCCSLGNFSDCLDDMGIRVYKNAVVSLFDPGISYQTPPVKNTRGVGHSVPGGSGKKYQTPNTPKKATTTTGQETGCSSLGNFSDCLDDMSIRVYKNAVALPDEDDIAYSECLYVEERRRGNRCLIEEVNETIASYKLNPDGSADWSPKDRRAELADVIGCGIGVTGREIPKIARLILRCGLLNVMHAALDITAKKNTHDVIKNPMGLFLKILKDNRAVAV